MTEQFHSTPESEYKPQGPEVREVRAGRLGKPPPDPEQAPQSIAPKSPDRLPLTSVWDYLERKVRLDAPDVEDRPIRESQEYKLEVEELNRLFRELDERGTPHDHLIIDLYGEIRCEPAPFPNPVRLRNLSLEEFQQFRSKVERLSDDEIADELRKAEEESDRKSDEFFKKKGGGFPPPNSIVHV
jgi:hypothetical protein